MKSLHTFVLVATALGLIGCSSPPVSSIASDSAQSWRTASEDVKAKMAEFVDQMAATYRRLGQDVKAQGYHLVFTDVGPESMERDDPDLFATLLSKASGGGVRFKGLSKAIVDGASVGDNKSGEKGVGFMLLDRKDDGRGGFDVTGAWYERQGAWHEVKYHLSNSGGKWRAE